ncbi:hypothetical protein CBOM_07202 [Ceraceosorus bombacis]|uniref:Uncharacterized protein n=1 Tax=Ceraceosorus bombacis TaxID=401625 RepID=A0A0P1B7E5_9BASI|nr:hypothetical protein CBOM_07202 [Ceraceosorus bombacis]
MASHLGRRQAGTFAPPGSNNGGGGDSWPWKWLLFLILIVFIFAIVVLVVWRVSRRRRRNRNRMSVLRNVNLVIAEDEKAKDKALSRGNSVMSRVSRMTSIRGGSSLQHQSSVNHGANAKSFESNAVSAKEKDAPRDDLDKQESKVLEHAYDIDEILISRGVLSASQRSKHSRYSQKSTSGRPLTTPARAHIARHGANHQQAPFRPGSERIELTDEPQDLEAGTNSVGAGDEAGSSSPRVRIVSPSFARPGGHAMRGRGGSRDVKELSVIGESGASEAMSTSALGLSRSETTASVLASGEAPSNESSTSSGSVAHASRYGHSQRGASQSTTSTDISPSAAFAVDPFKSPAASSSGHGNQASWSAISQHSNNAYTPVTSHGHIAPAESSDHLHRQGSTKLQRDGSNKGGAIGRRLSAVIRLKQPKSPRDPRTPNVEIMQRQETPSPEFEMMNGPRASEAQAGTSAAAFVTDTKAAHTLAAPTTRDAEQQRQGRTSLALSDKSASTAGQRYAIGSPQSITVALPAVEAGEKEQHKATSSSEVGSGPWTYTSKAQQWRDQKAAAAAAARQELGLSTTATDANIRRSSSMRTPESSTKNTATAVVPSKTSTSATHLAVPTKSHSIEVGSLPSSPLKRTPSIGVAGSKFKETFDDDD